ncbi:MAG: diguanylate cyclase [Coriobacteriales bacterium]|nr:diguanylate cyclase [Coriobacteriales bacterium]
MRSIRTRVTLLTVCAIVVAVMVVTIIGAFGMRNVVVKNADETLYLVCETGRNNLNQYLGSVQQSASMISSVIKTDLKGFDEEELAAHVERMRSIFSQVAIRTQGVRTYYYRIDPTLSSTVKGFWYVDEGRNGFQEREVTDISGYDLNDTSRLVWFTVPRATGRSVWLPPYITDNLDELVISYDVPVYRDNVFVGVVGIEIDYETLARQVDSVSMEGSGYAYLIDKNGSIVYHPDFDMKSMTDPTSAPEGLLNNREYVSYTYEGVRKRAVNLGLSNLMHLVVCLPYEEIDKIWLQPVIIISCVSAGLIVAFALLARLLSNRITKPLQELTEVAGRVNEGDYDVELSYARNDEVGVLTGAFNRLIAHLRVYVGDLNNLAYADALTNVRNKGAFTVYMRELDEQLSCGQKQAEFAFGMFDCDGLKRVNDQYGHEKGDLYLQASCAMICRVFQHSPVFRIGGDEFAVILEGEDFINRDVLIELFNRECARSCEIGDEPWSKLSISAGIVLYDPSIDSCASDTLRRADELMYANKRERKMARE